MRLARQVFIYRIGWSVVFILRKSVWRVGWWEKPFSRENLQPRLY